LPFDPQAVLRFKSVAVALIGVLAAAMGVWAVGLFGDYFEANPHYAPVMVTSALGIDVLGALAPIAAALAALAVFLKTTRKPVKKLYVAFLACVALAFLLCRVTPEGLAGYPLMFAVGSSIAAAAVNIYPKPFVDLQKKFASTILLTIACVPLALFLVDLVFSPSFFGAVIGGNGLTDGLLLSTLYAPEAVIGVFFALFYASQMLLLVQATRNPSKVQPQSKTGAVAS
jgi:hypothetical protein